jgi:hypothetical protein
MDCVSFCIRPAVTTFGISGCEVGVCTDVISQYFAEFLLEKQKTSPGRERKPEVFHCSY